MGASLLVAGCGASQGGGPDAGVTDASPVVDTGVDAPVLETSGPVITTLHVHYPAGSHTVTVRGSGGGLDWTTGANAIAAGDVFTYAITSLAAPIEWKPLLDDATWSRGPNYHVMPGQTLDVWPHFDTMTGQVVTLIADFHSAVLSNDRAIYAYLPASYAENTDATFPVVYMHDGQNLWAALPQLAFSGTWNVDTTFDTATEHGACSQSGLAAAGPLSRSAARPRFARAMATVARRASARAHLPRGHRHRRREHVEPHLRVHAHDNRPSTPGGRRRGPLSPDAGHGAQAGHRREAPHRPGPRVDVARGQLTRRPRHRVRRPQVPDCV